MDAIRVKFLPGNPLSYTTTKITVLHDDTELSTATGFVTRVGQKFALVTNWRVLSGLNPIDGTCLSKMGAVPNRIECHVTLSRAINEGRGEEIYFKPLAIDLTVGERPNWHDDRDGQSQNDYAVIDLAGYIPELGEEGVSLRSIAGGRISFRRGFDPRGKETFNIEDIQSIYPPVGAEVFVLGYPRGVTRTGVFPIWKRGSIASEPQASLTLGGIEYRNVLYIDALTKPGMSGSPVVCLARAGERFCTDDGLTIEIKEAEPFIVGVYAGRDGVTQEEYELSVGRVWKIGAVERLIFKTVTEDRSASS